MDMHGNIRRACQPPDPAVSPVVLRLSRRWSMGIRLNRRRHNAAIASRPSSAAYPARSRRHCPGVTPVARLNATPNAAWL